MHRRIAAYLPVVALLLFCAAADARPKTDTVRLYNGDSITGEIKGMQGGKLSYGTEALGTISIEWKEVAQINSNINYEVRTSNGDRYFGNIGSTENGGKIKVSVHAQSLTLDSVDIVELRPVQKTVADRTDIYLSAGINRTRANDLSQTSFNTAISYEDEKARNSLNGRSVVTNTDTNNNQSNRYTLARQTWTDRGQLFRYLGGSYEDNDELGLDSRFTAGLGLGRYFIDSERGNVSAIVGVQVVTERNVDSVTQESIEGILATRVALWRFDSPELDLEYNLQLYPSLTESGRLRGDTNLRLRWELFTDLYWDVTGWVSYDNETEVEGTSEADWGFTTGLGWEF